MNEPTEKVDSVLAALRAVDAPQGMEDRIHAALLHASQETKASPVRWLPIASGCSIAVLSLLLGMKLSLHHGRWQHSTAAPVASSAKPSSATVRKATPSSISAPAEPGLARFAPHKNALHRASAAPLQAMATSDARRHEYIPEPPLPTTDQERLLLKLVHRDSAVHLAAYTEPARAIQARKDSWQFHAFFTPPPRPPEPPLESQLVSSQPTYDQHPTGESR